MKKIAYVMDQVITCGGVIVPFMHCRLLRQNGYDAFIIANGGNDELQKRFNEVPVRNMLMLEQMTDEDVIVAVWHPQMEMLEKFKGKKVQFIQGNDLKADVGDDWIQFTIKNRKRPGWKAMAVSNYAGEWTGVPFEVVPNSVDDTFFVPMTYAKSWDILIEGNNEPNKGIDEALEIAKEVGGEVAWLGRETKQVPWLRAIYTNPPQNMIPRIYQEAKIVLKTSRSEGFGLPHLEAMASGSVLVSYNSGGNMDFCVDGANCRIVNRENAASVIKELLNDPEQMEKLKSGGFETAAKYQFGKNLAKLKEVLGC